MVLDYTLSETLSGKARESFLLQSGATPIEQLERNELPRNLESGDSCYKSVSYLTSEQIRERKILLEFFQALNGTKWLANKHWDEDDKPHCDCWTGISCYKAGNYTGLVQTIDLKENNLTGQCPKSLLDLTVLEELRLSKNSIRMNLSKFLGDSTTKWSLLQRFDMATCELFGHIPWHIFASWPSLRKIQLGDNTNLTGSIGENIGEITNLGVLSLGHSGIRGSLPQSFEKLVNLWFLDLQFLQLVGDFSQLLHFTKLQYFHAVQNNLTGNIPTDFSSRYRSLVEFSIPENSLSGTLPNFDQPLVNLTVLNLRHNHFSGPVLPLVLNSSTLRYVDLSHNQFTSILPGFNMSSIGLFIAENNLLNLTVNDLDELFVCFVRKCPQRLSIKVLDFSSTGLRGDFLPTLWMMTNIFSIDLSNNSISGVCKSPYLMMLYLQVLDLSDNDLEGEIPSRMSMFQSVLIMNFTGNENMRSSASSTPWFVKPDYQHMSKESETDNFTCPALVMKHTKGWLKVDSKYYNRSVCHCLPGFYGFNGFCKRCPANGSHCPGKQINSKLQMFSNYYPSPSPDDFSNLILCSSIYQDTFRCNPSNNCTCWLSGDGVSRCDKSCICQNNATGRVCSLCNDGCYDDGNKCRQCSSEPTWSKVVYVVVGLLVALAPLLWIINMIIKYKYPQWKHQKLASWIIVFATVGGLSVFVFALLFVRVIPTYVAEIYFLFILIATIDFARDVKVLVVIFVFYLQVLDAMHVTLVEVQCPDCSFVNSFKDLHFYQFYTKLGSIFNFRFSGLACLVPIMFEPIPHLLLLAALPLVFGLFLLIVHLIDYGFFLCLRKPTEDSADSERTNKKLRAINSVKRHFVSVLNLFFFPTSKSTLKVFAGCYTSEDNSYMKAFPWIPCSSSQYHWLEMQASITFVFYGIITLIVFLVSLRLHANKCNCQKKDFSWRHTARIVCGQNATDNGDEEKENDNNDSVMCHYCIPYKSPYNRFMALLVMLRRLLTAAILALFTWDNRDLQSLAFNGLLLLYLTIVCSTRPYNDVWENVMEITANTMVLVTFNCMTNRDYENKVASDIVTITNFVFGIILVLSALTKAFLLWKYYRAKTAARQGQGQGQGQRRGSNEPLLGDQSAKKKET